MIWLRQKRALYSQRDTITPFFQLIGINAAIEPDGDTLLYIVESRYFQPTNHNRHDLFCLNITKNQQLFKRDSFSPGVNVQAPVLHGNLLLFGGGGTAFAIDRHTGAPVWRKPASGSSVHQLQIADGLLLYSDWANGILYAFDPDTGAEKWRRQVGPTFSMPRYANGVVYFTSKGDGHLYAVRMRDGAVVWKLRSPDLDEHSGSSWSFGASVDPQTNRVYAATFTAAYCLPGYVE